MKTKINTEKLKTFLQESSDGFTKHLIQEGIKSLLLEGEGETSITMKSYLEDLGLITIEPMVVLFDKNSKNSKLTLENFCKTKVCDDRNWNYSGLKDNVNFFGTQKDWNQTLITMINQVSSKIHEHSLNGGGNTIILSNDISYLIDDLEYFHGQDEYREFDDYIYFGKLGNRYEVISLNSNLQSKNEIIICRKEVYLKENSKPDNKLYGKINILNVNPYLPEGSKIQSTVNISEDSKNINTIKEEDTFFGSEFTCTSKETTNGLIQKTVYLGDSFNVNNLTSTTSLEIIAKTPVAYDGKILFDIGSKIPFYSDLSKLMEIKTVSPNTNFLNLVLDVRPNGVFGSDFKPELLGESFNAIPKFII